MAAQSGERHVVVVGGGLAGLAAATFAAREGAAVTLLEAREGAGGRARTTTVERGYLFNEGPHALYAGRAGWRVLAELGIEPRGERPPLKASGRLRGRWGVLPGAPADLARTDLIGWRSKAALTRLLARPQRLADFDATGRSFAQWLAEHIRDDDSRAIVRMLGRIATYCDDMDGIAADAVVDQVLGAFVNGVRYLDGGWQQLVDGIAARAKDAGVVVRTGARVERVASHDDHVEVVSAAGTHRAGAVILAAGGPSHADHLLGGASAAVHEWAATERPIHAVTLDLALARLPRRDRRVAFGVDEPLYLSTHTPSADLGGDGGEVVHVMRYGDGDVATLERMLDDLQPGWRTEVIAQQIGRSRVVAYGRPEPGRGLAGRPPVGVPDLAGVFVAGDWVGGEGLLPTRRSRAARSPAGSRRAPERRR